ncbi:Rieske 2Fe-2S domain-containing protein [Candidatus Poriferisocius sp.]|uniref:aromatic ring-hydroxylating dioxygenase subunit alpha n=1 Tax=Candidatus Poriferisocius sp. TaxID=3101276 RepID=UPI003B5CDF27
MLIKNHWYALEFGHNVGDQPIQAPVHGHDLVLWRGPDGMVNAQSDLCIHRGGSLAGGTVVGDCIRCPYHGWRFDRQGTCVEIPANRPDLPIPKRARIDTYPCVERYGFVWVFLGDLPPDERPPVPALDGLEEHTAAKAEGYRPIFGDFTWQANYDRVLENAVDIAHTPFVHAGSFGNADQPEIQDFDLDETHHNGYLTSVTATVDLEPPRPSGMWRFISKKDRPPVSTTTGFYPPNVSLLIVRLPLGEIRIFTAAVPRDEHTTVSKFCMLRTFFTGGWADKNSMQRTIKIFLEDQPTVEGQRPELLPFDLSAELHVKSDSIQLAYRRWRQEQLDRGWGLAHPTDDQSRRAAAVIASPGRANDPELAGAWVFPAVPQAATGDQQAAVGQDTQEAT